MPEQQTNLLAPLLKKLLMWTHLDDSERSAVLALPHMESSVEKGGYIVRDGEKPRNSCLILSGFACRQKLVSDGEMQIMSIHMRGDFVDLQNSMLGTADHSVQALTQMRVANVPIEAVLQLCLEYPKVGLALWYDTLVDAAIFREWIVNVGRRGARKRLAHLLCEFAVRLEQAGLADKCDYVMPMTQAQLADCTGLTPVHINRTLKGLDEENLIVRTKGSVRIPDWHKLAEVGDFQSQYLQPQQERLLNPSHSWMLNQV